VPQASATRSSVRRGRATCPSLSFQGRRIDPRCGARGRILGRESRLLASDLRRLNRSRARAHRTHHQASRHAGGGIKRGESAAGMPACQYRRRRSATPAPPPKSRVGLFSRRQRQCRGDAECPLLLVARARSIVQAGPGKTLDGPCDDRTRSADQQLGLRGRSADFYAWGCRGTHANLGSLGLPLSGCAVLRQWTAVRSADGGSRQHVRRVVQRGRPTNTTSCWMSTEMENRTRP